jgi:haloalkane dehalogenase
MGMNDSLFASEEVIARWQGLFPEAGVDRVADAGHYFQEDRPDRLAAAIRRVIDQLEACIEASWMKL